MAEQKDFDQVIDDIVKDLNKEAQEPEGQSEPQEPQEPQTQEPQEETKQEELVVEINGQQVPLEELKKGYMRAQDYTQKLAELAEKRKELAYLEDLSQRITPDKLEQIKAIIDGDQTLSQEQKDAMQQYLGELDPEDPVAKSLQTVLKELQEIKQQVEQQKTFVATKQQEEFIEYATRLLENSVNEATKGKEFVNDVEKELYTTLVYATLEALQDIPVQTENDVKMVVSSVCDGVYQRLQEYRNSIASSKPQTVPTGVGGSAPQQKTSVPSAEDIIKEKGWEAAVDVMVDEIFKKTKGGSG